MNILGVDLSTKAVTAVMLDHEENLIDWWHVEAKGDNALDRAVYFTATERLEEVPWHKASIVCFERPAGKGTAAVMDMMRVEGVCLYSIWEDCWPIYERPEIWEMGPSDWKKKVGLPGNASKQAIWEFAVQDIRVTKETPILHAEDLPQDFYDAYCVALAAVRENQKGLTRAREENLGP